MLIGKNDSDAEDKEHSSVPKKIDEGELEALVNEESLGIDNKTVL